VNYPRRTGFSGLTYTVMKSDDLNTWTPVTYDIFDENTTQVPGKSVEMVTDKVKSPAQRSFFRLKVNQ